MSKHNRIVRGSCQGYVFAGTFGLLQRQASLGENFCAPQMEYRGRPSRKNFLTPCSNITLPPTPNNYEISYHNCDVLHVRKRLIEAFLFSAFCFLSTVCYAQGLVSSTDLIEHARELDGREVAYQGEVIGEVMNRGDHSWVNLNDGENAVGIWLDNNLLGIISFCGSYKARGDWLEVRGIFNRACKMHGADLDIHAINVKKTREGRAIRHRLPPAKQKLAIILSGVLLCLLIGQLLSRKLKKK